MAGLKEIIEKLKPIPPEEGPPLPRAVQGVGLLAKWPWKWRK